MKHVHVNDLRAVTNALRMILEGIERDGQQGYSFDEDRLMNIETDLRWCADRAAETRKAMPL